MSSKFIGTTNMKKKNLSPHNETQDYTSTTGTRCGMKTLVSILTEFSGEYLRMIRYLKRRLILYK